MSNLPLPEVDTTRCTGCRRCIEACPVEALAQVAEKAAVLYPERCTYCTICEDVCPEYAIALPFLVVFGRDA